MFDFIMILFSAIGFVICASAISSGIVCLDEKFKAARARKQAHDKRLLTLLESIDQKLNAKP